MAKTLPKRNPLGDLSTVPESYVETIGSGRKARKDFMGRKTDYHQGTQALAVRLPNDLAERVRRLAEMEQMSVNAWLAQLIKTQVGY